MAVRRVRGVILDWCGIDDWRVSVLAMMVPAIWLEFSGRSGTWWLDGLGLVGGATGAALVWAGLRGSRPDWIDDGWNQRILPAQRPHASHRRR